MQYVGSTDERFCTVFAADENSFVSLFKRNLSGYRFWRGFLTVVFE